MVPITERFLSECGGWQALREARGMLAAGRVLDAAYVPPLLEGRVRTAESEVRAGLRILSATNVENTCTCRESRREGRICAHSLAVGLAFLSPRPAAVPTAAPIPAKPAPVAAGAAFSTESGEPAELHVVLPPNFAGAWEKGGIHVGLEAGVAGRRTLVSALDRAKVWRVSAADLALIDKWRALHDGATPGLSALPREAFLALLSTLSGHPRVTFGRAAASVGGQGMSLDSAPPASAHILAAGPHAWLLDATTFTPLVAARTPPTIERLSSAPAPAGFELKLEGSLNYLAAEISVRYGDSIFAVEARAPRRNPAAEDAALDRLRASGFTGPDAKAQLVLKGEPRILAFFARDLPRLQREWKVTIGERFEHVTRDIERIAPRFEVRGSGENWFDLQFELGTGGGDRFSASDIQRLLQTGQTSTRLKNRKLAVFDPGLIEEFGEILRDCDPQQKQPGLYRFDHRHAAFLNAVASEHGVPVQAGAEWQRIATLGSETSVPPIPLGDLEGVLRPYQKHGVFWLTYLAGNGLGGILADEMGLGKTIQALAFLRTNRGKSLVVCPSSLIFNWQREAQRFAPELRVLAIQGADRQELFERESENADLLITSYPLLRRDLDRYRGMEFQTVILDEAQHIKNPDTQNAQAAFAIRARHRFALTGTPIENSVRDLWSLMHFLMPGYLGSRDDFQERYERPIQSDPSGPELSRLRGRLKPFLLRRLKKDVVSELPDKIEQVAYCELGSDQRAAYDQLVRSARKQVDELSGEKNAGRAKIAMLTALLRLRQACCDLRLLGLPESGDTAPPSAKIEILQELLAEAIDGGHRVLVFSQFVTMLALLRQALTESGTEYCYLDGQTRDRAAEVDRFQAGAIPVFLISLKAGGIGLNLTAADTVIHFDPWWNPAVEAQATDRAHRIGQEKVVTSYKLIARGTVEEKILALQQRKRATIEAALESEQPLMEALSLDEIRELLS